MASTLTSHQTDNAVPAPQRRFMRNVIILAMVGALGLLGGFLGAAGRPAVTAVFLGLVVTLLVVSSRTAIFWCVAVGGLVITGACQLYLPGSRYVRYVVPLASLALLLHWVSDAFKARLSGEVNPMPKPMVWALAFVGTGLVSTLINLSDPLVALIGLKDYFQLWALFLGLVFVRWRPSFTKTVFWGLVLIALLQVPFAIQQHIYLVPQRIGLEGQGIVPADVVAGTFGAYLLGGGANAVLAAFEVIMIGCMLALWKNGALSLFKTGVLVLLFLVPMLVNEAKVTLLYIPIIFVVVFYRDIVRKPFKFLLAGLGMMGALSVLMTGLLLAQPADKFHNASEMLDFIITRQTADVPEREGQYAALSRFTALTFWAKEHVASNPIHTLLGHGLGQSREPEGGMELAETLAKKRYAGLRIGYTAVSGLLWDTGLVGLTIVMLMFGSAFVTAGKIATYYRDKDKFKTGMYEGLQASMPVLALSLAHKDFFVVHLPFQTLTYLLIGFICYSWLEVQRAESHGRTA